VELANIVTVNKAKYAIGLVDSDSLGYPRYILVESASNKHEVAGNRSLLYIGSKSNNILSVCFCVSLRVLNIDVLGVYTLFVVAHHDHKGQSKTSWSYLFEIISLY
jgi:hypothetical protein